VINAVIDQAQIHLHPVLVREETEEMLHQLSHMLEGQHMSMDQYLLMMRKSREEYLKELEPEAEQRVKRQLVLDEVVKKENLTISPEEVEAFFRVYAQMGQNLPRTETQIAAVGRSLLRENAIQRLLELTTDPDPDAAEETDEVTEMGEVAETSGAVDTIEIATAEVLGEAPEPAETVDTDAKDLGETEKHV
jgi:trigger factor